jgi:hypothetical protein
VLPCGGLRVKGEKRPRLLSLDDQLMMRTRNVAAARAMEVVSRVVRLVTRSYALFCQDVGLDAGLKICSLACAKAAFNEDRLPCDKLEMNWSKRLEDATVTTYCGIAARYAVVCGQVFHTCWLRNVFDG